MSFVLGQPPAWRLITNNLHVQTLVRELMTRLEFDDLDQERMDQYTPLIEQAERVRDLLPWQRGWLDAVRLLFEAKDHEEISASEAVFDEAMDGIL